uniref:CUB domain-containing protein n=1 Tax=Tetranychus urticae TaxID=32264 RepID=T1KAS2_TETUR
MIPIIGVSLFFVNLIESTVGCDPCYSKVFKLSYGSTHNLLVEAHINVIEHEEIFKNHLNITLIGHNVEERVFRKISLKLQKKDQFFTYSCSKSTHGATEAIIAENYNLRSGGSSIYLPDKLICWWILDNYYWPFMNNKPMDLVNECDYQIFLISDQTSALVANNGEDVPICGMKYTKCVGNQNYGNNNYSLIIKPNDNTISFYLQVRIADTPKVTEVKLTSSDGTRISIICNHTQYNVSGYISDNFGSPSIPLSQLDYSRVTNIECGWILPQSITYSNKFYEIAKIKGELSIIADGSTVYQENHFKLTNFTTKKSTNLLIIILPIVLILIFIILILSVIYRKRIFHYIFHRFSIK